MNDYIEVRIDASPCSSDITDIAAALLADVGFESFVPDETGLTAYVKKELFNRDAIDEALSRMPIPTSIKVTTNEIEGRDWNSEWEKNYFKPIVIAGRCAIHSTFHRDVPLCDYDIVIDPKMAFGTGHHATTSQMAARLLDNDINNLTIVDMGTGTGILAILAAMRGATKVYAVEIDPTAHANAIENLALNGVNDRVDLRLGDVGQINDITDADWLLANINRNIILGDIAAYSRPLKPGGRMMLSGFYTDDIPMIIEAADACRLRYDDHTESNRWACVALTKLNS